MRVVDATFYFKDGTILYVKADNGIYNNKTLDMKFEQNVNANYMNSELFAEKAEYSNSESFFRIGLPSKDLLKSFTSNMGLSFLNFKILKPFFI